MFIPYVGAAPIVRNNDSPTINIRTKSIFDKKRFGQKAFRTKGVSDKRRFGQKAFRTIDAAPHMYDINNF